MIQKGKKMKRTLVLFASGETVCPRKHPTCRWVNPYRTLSSNSDDRNHN